MKNILILLLLIASLAQCKKDVREITQYEHIFYRIKLDAQGEIESYSYSKGDDSFKGTYFNTSSKRKTIRIEKNGLLIKYDVYEKTPFNQWYYYSDSTPWRDSSFVIYRDFITAYENGLPRTYAEQAYSRSPNSMSNFHTYWSGLYISWKYENYTRHGHIESNTTFGYNTLTYNPKCFFLPSLNLKYQTKNLQSTQKYWSRSYRFYYLDSSHDKLFEYELNNENYVIEKIDKHVSHTDDFVGKQIHHHYIYEK